ncbi:DUF3830 family protein [Caulobacter segnis]|uniref:DUF3830 family protein n=1 Tax=Caulobacter segnis TaxID=88688 RepID=UPI0024100F01|nr:DUF3830 family protein [Caulobacter segnis]MDG2520426.1 DUF3830 family protein [Caulobacter segnis]
MTRLRLSEPRSGLNARFNLLEEQAPGACAALVVLARQGLRRAALHAMWTGPEISCPLPGKDLPLGIDLDRLTVENPVRHPSAGDLVLTPFTPGPVGPTRPFAEGGLDLGVFYGDDGRLFFPGGWIEGSLCAQVLAEDLSGLAEAARRIRQNGACELMLDLEP